MASVLVASCSSSEDPTFAYPVVDQKGRRCEFDCGANDCSLACDRPAADAGAMCAAPSTSCLIVATANDPHLAGLGTGSAEVICAGCCEAGGTTDGDLSDCSPVVCSSDSDCYADGYFCESGVCTCAGTACPTLSGAAADGGTDAAGGDEAGPSATD